MNIQNLKVGQVVKNYKAMCEILGEKVKAGDSKKSQLKEWSRFMDYDKEGNKMIVKEIYDAPLEKVVNYIRNSKYSDLLDLLILDLLAQSEGVLAIGKNRLMELVGMINFNYSLGKNMMSSISDKLDTDYYTVRDFYSSNDSNLSSAIEKSLKRLSSKSLLFYNYTYMIKSSKDGYYRMATDEDLKIISLIERRILDKMNAESKNEVIKSGKWKEFKSTMTDGLDVVSDIDYYFRAYKIIFSPDNATNAKFKMMEKLLPEDERKYLLKKVNDTVMTSNNDNAMKKSLKSTDKKIHRQSNEYVKKINELSYLLISRDNNIRLRELINSGEVKSNKAMSDKKLAEIMDAIDGLF